jgi:hypothetical protein
VVRALPTAYKADWPKLTEQIDRLPGVLHRAVARRVGPLDR